VIFCRIFEKDQIAIERLDEKLNFGGAYVSKIDFG
jgi:hypothetical protein